MIIQNLKRFNSKERYHLIRSAFGNTEFRLGESFREKLRDCLGLNVPEDAFAAMDYHLDWIYASLYLATSQEQPPYRLSSDKEISGTQQDVDLLIAYESDGICHVVMVEAKGVLPFSNRDLNRKAKRLGVIWGDDGGCWPNAKPHFVIASPRKPEKLTYAEWPSWMLQKNKWLRLDIDQDQPLQKVTRLNRVQTSKNQYAKWKVEQIKI